MQRLRALRGAAVGAEVTTHSSRERALLAAVLVASALHAGAAAASPPHRATTTSEIVFASDRANIDSGEIYTLGAGRAPVDVSLSPAVDKQAALAPDGKRVAFWSHRTGTWQLYLARPDGTALRRVPLPISARADAESPPVFSPDGSRLLVPAFVTQCRFFLVDVRSLRVLRTGEGCNGTSWSADGSRFAAVVGFNHVAVYDAEGHRRFALPGTRALWSARGRLAVGNATTVVVDENGSLLARLPGEATAWSADGRRLALQRLGAILLADSASLAHTRVLARGANRAAPGDGVQFTPDGGFVRYQRASGAWAAIAVTGGTPRPLPGGGTWARDGRYAYTRPLAPAHAGGQPRVRVEIGDRFGGKPRIAGLFPTDSHGVSRLTWSTDGSRLLYESSVRTGRDLWAVAADGSNLRRLTSQGGPDSYEPAWSFDGMRLAYTKASFSDDLCGFCGAEAAVVIADALARVQSTVPGPAAGQASWAPTGAQLVVSVCCSSELDVVGVDGSGRVTLAPGPAGRTAGAGAWSPDGTAIAYGSTRGIELIAPDGSGRRLLVGSPATAPAWSHDGKLLAYSAPDGIYVVPADGSAPPRLVASDHASGRPSFSPDGSELVYAAPRQEPGREAQTDLFIASLQGGPVRALAAGPYNDSDPAWRPLPGK